MRVGGCCSEGSRIRHQRHTRSWRAVPLLPRVGHRTGPCLHHRADTGDLEGLRSKTPGTDIPKTWLRAGGEGSEDGCGPGGAGAEEPLLAWRRPPATHVRLGDSRGVLDLAKHHFHLVHAPALPQLLLLVALVVLNCIFRLQQYMVSVGLLEGGGQSRALSKSTPDKGLGQRPGEDPAQRREQDKGLGLGTGVQ